MENNEDQATTKKLKLISDASTSPNFPMSAKAEPTASVFDRFLANVEVWDRMFKFLGVRERICLERVSKRLRELAFYFWRHEKSLYLFEAPPGKLRTNVEAVAERCPNLESLHYAILSRDRFYFALPPDILFSSFSQLRVLRVVAPQTTDWERHHRAYVNTSAAVLMSIPRTIEVIDGLAVGGDDSVGQMDLSFESADQVEQFFVDRPHLREINIHVIGVNPRSRGVANIFHLMAVNCPNLKNLKLMGARGANFDWESIVELSGMTTIFVGGCFRYSDEQLIHICEVNPDLEVLYLGGLSYAHLSVVAFKAIASLRQLRDLTMTSSHGALSPAAMVEVLQLLLQSSGHTLESLDLGCCWYLTSAMLKSIGLLCPRMRRLKCFISARSATPHSLRLLMNYVATGVLLPGDIFTLEVGVDVHGVYSAMEPFRALSMAENLPSGVRLNIYLKTS